MKSYSKMTIEEKAKAYDKALSKAREYHFQGQAPDKLAELESIFPELRESEDERTRKEIIQFFRDASNSKTRVVNSNTFAEWATYLEKQKEQKPVEWSEEDKRMLERAIHIIVEYSDIDKKESEIVQNWLKSLRPKSKEELAKMLQDEYNKGREEGERIGHTKGYNEAYKDAEEAYNKTVSYHP